MPLHWSAFGLTLGRLCVCAGEAAVAGDPVGERAEDEAGARHSDGPAGGALRQGPEGGHRNPR